MRVGLPGGRGGGLGYLGADVRMVEKSRGGARGILSALRTGFRFDKGPSSWTAGEADVLSSTLVAAALDLAVRALRAAVLLARAPGRTIVAAVFLPLMPPFCAPAKPALKVDPDAIAASSGSSTTSREETSVSTSGGAKGAIRMGRGGGRRVVDLTGSTA